MSFKGLSYLSIRGGGRISAVAGLLVLIAALLSAFPAAAQNKVLGKAILSDDMGDMSLAPYTLVQKDPQNAVTPQSIRSSGGRILTGAVQDGTMIDLGPDGTPAWLTVKLLGNAADNEWVIDLGRRAQGRIGSIKTIKLYEAAIGADGISLKDIPESDGNGIFKLNVGKGEEKLILFNIAPSSGRPVVLPLTIYSESVYAAHVQTRSVFNAVFCTILCGFALFFFAYSMGRLNKDVLAYGGYFTVIALMWFLYNGLGAGTGSSIFGFLLSSCALLGTIATIFMTKVYWKIDGSSYTEKYILYSLAWLNVVAFILPVLLPGSIHGILYYGAPLMTIFVLTLMSFAQSRSAQVPDYFFFFSWLPLLFGHGVTVLASMGVLGQNIVTINFFWYMLIPQGVLLIIAVHRKESMTPLQTSASGGSSQILNLDKLKETKEGADHSRLLKVIEKEREMLAEIRAREEMRVNEMQSAKEEADEANRAKSAFLAVVSHEIRTPMTGVMGMVRLLLDSNITKQQRDYALTIQESSEAMLSLLNDILDFEKIQRGKIELENISFDLHRLIQGVVNLMSGHAAQKNIGLSARMNDDLPKFVKGDPTRLRQILLNLMGNAIKFTSEGGVTLYVKTMAPTEMDGTSGRFSKQSRHMIYFAVQDTGIGIPAEAQKNLFNPFSQADSSIARKFGGTGLGLAISKGLVERMGSAININSKDGDGSTFFFTLEMEAGIPIHQESLKAVEIEPPAAQAEPLQILVVDDNAITQKVAVSFLQKDRHYITTATTADEALNKIDKHAFDIILMDIELPGMSGNEATKILRKHQDPAKAALPVIAMTGNVERDDIQRYLSEGMSGFVAKPIDPDKLRAAINEAMGKSQEREIRAPFMPAKTVTPPPSPAPSPVIQTPETPTTASTTVFNPDMLQSLKDAIGEDQLNELLADLVVKTDEILEAMIVASDNGDMEALGARAHELKGMAGNFGLVEISGIAGEAERKVKAQQPDGLSLLVSTLPDASQRARSALKDWAAQ